MLIILAVSISSLFDLSHTCCGERERERERVQSGQKSNEAQRSLSILIWRLRWKVGRWLSFAGHHFFRCLLVFGKAVGLAVAVVVVVDVVVAVVVIVVRRWCVPARLPRRGLQ